MGDWIESVGAFHMHSRYSDGTGDMADILGAARGANLDHLVLTDHDTLAAQREGWPGRHGGVTLIVAPEITPHHRGHVLAFHVDHCEGYAVQHNRSTLDAVAEQGGFAIVAHPMGKRKPLLGIHQRPWYDWAHPAIRGMEIWSYTHDWVDEVAWWRLPQAYEFWRHPERRVNGPYRHVLAMWDRLGHRRPMAGWGGLDCHARIVPLVGINIFPYADMFRYMRNHVFLPAERAARDPSGALLDAIERGRGFVAHDVIADSAGTRCDALLPDGRVMQMGEEADFVPGTVIRLRLPRRADVHWRVDGRRRIRETTDTLDLRPCGPSVCRFEALLHGRPWIYTNPFYFRNALSAGSRR